MLRPRFARVLASVLFGAPFLACGTEVVQTAVEGAREPLDCALKVKPALPEDDVFGDGSEPSSVLVGEGYGAGEGPGLYLTARDAYRVYLNGKLVVESESPRKATFVPLTLLPGTNALSIVVAAERGTPAALVQVDELSKSYVSNSGWKVSSAPEAGFTGSDFDDSSWAAATDYGPLGALPGCDPDDEYSAESDAHWIGPAADSGKVVVLRKTILITPTGYGEGTKGGSTATPKLAETWDDLVTLAADPDPTVILLSEGMHDFRDEPRDQLVCPSTCTDDPSKPQYNVLNSSQTCAVDQVTRSLTNRTLLLASNKTLVGLGRGAALRGVTLDLGSSHQVIVRNVALYDVNPDLNGGGDAFRMDTVSRVWLDHCTAKWISDSFTGINGGQNVTLSWLRYDGSTPYVCERQATRAAQFRDATVTVHHSFFDHLQSHSPRVDNGATRAHLFNNLLSDNLGYAVGVTCGAQALLEGNTFQHVATPTSRSTCSDDTNPGLIDAPEGSNVYDDVGPHTGPGGLEPHDSVFDPPYDYSVDTRDDAWLTILSRAGAGGPWALPLELD